MAGQSKQKKPRRPRPLGKLFFIFLALCLIATAAANLYVVYLLGQNPLPIDKIRLVTILTATGILVFILLLILMFVFTGGIAAKLFVGVSGIISIIILLSLIVVMGLDYAIPPVLKGGEPNVDRARTFAIVASVFGILLALIVILRLVIGTVRRGKEEKEESGEEVRMRREKNK